MVTENMVRTYEGKQVFSEEQETDLLLNECLKQFKKPRSLHTVAPISELPSNINTMLIPCKRLMANICEEITVEM